MGEHAMAARAFDTSLETIGQVLAGPWRKPANMLQHQTYDNHVSLHDDAMAQKLGFKAGPIEGPTHFSQFAPLGEAVWGERFLSEGCLSAHYRNMVMEGEEVRAFIEREPGADHATIWAQKRDGTEVLRGTASVGRQAPPTALDRRLGELSALSQPVILRDLKPGHRTTRRRIRMDAAQHMGDLYPFSLAQKLEHITERSSWYAGADTPWNKPVVPFEMISVLLQYTAREDALPIKGPAVGLFADQEIRLIEGPLFVGDDYEIEREIVALSGSRRTESYWTRTLVYRPGESRVIATMLLNQATLKESYAPYANEHAQLYPTG
jgi:hypothetical protein